MDQETVFDAFLQELSLNFLKVRKELRVGLRDALLVALPDLPRQWLRLQKVGLAYTTSQPGKNTPRDGHYQNLLEEQSVNERIEEGWSDDQKVGRQKPSESEVAELRPPGPLANPGKDGVWGLAKGAQSDANANEDETDEEDGPHFCERAIEGSVDGEALSDCYAHQHKSRYREAGGEKGQYQESPRKRARRARITPTTNRMANVSKRPRRST